MNSPQFFLDSSFFIAIIDSRDLHHSKAIDILNKIETADSQFFASDVTINEVLSVLAKRCESRRATEQFDGLIVKLKKILEPLPILCLYELVPQYYGAVMEMMSASEARLNFHDCLIALFLKEVPEVNLVTFDSDFDEVENLRVYASI